MEALPIPADGRFLRLTLRGDRYDMEGLSRGFLSPVKGGARDVGDGAVFSEWNWDGRELTLRTDRLGFFPLFYARREGEILVGASLRTLIEQGADTELDDAGLASYLRLKFFLGEDTPFKSIRVLPPGGHLRWTAGSCEMRGGFTNPKPQSLSRSAAMDLYAQVFREAVRRRIPDDRRWVLPLSGGQDSRHILFTLGDLGRLPQACVTARYFPPTEDEDSEAAQVAQALGMKHEAIAQDRSELVAELKKNALTHHCTIEHGWIVALMEHVASRYRGLFDGIGGDVLSAGLFLDEKRLRLFEGGRLRDLGECVLGNEGYLPGLLSAAAYRRFNRELALDRVVGELGRHVDAANPVGSFYFWNRTRRCVALGPFGILNRACSVFTPYLDPDVHGLLASLPAAMFLDHRFHADTIARAFPRFAEIPYHPRGARRAGGVGAYRRLAADLLRYSRGSSRRLARRSFVTVRALRGLVDHGYAPAVESFGSLAIYVLQLEKLLD
jgi:asparagine synthase (glutamine-hydrolysing)